jgi:repressor LexA
MIDLHIISIQHLPMSMNKDLPSLTPKEKAVLVYLIEYISSYDMSPTFTEIQKAFGYSSVNSVQNYVRQLERKGYIALKPHQKRAIRLLAAHSDYSSKVSNIASQLTDDMVDIPVQAKVAAGRPLEYFVYDRSVKVDKTLLPKTGSLFAVEVVGDSMIESGILSGDMIIVSKIKSIYPGITAVVSIEDEGATVKKIYPQASQGSFELRPANSVYQSRVVSESNLRIEGQVVALVRKY